MFEGRQLTEMRMLIVNTMNALHYSYIFSSYAQSTKKKLFLHILKSTTYHRGEASTSYDCFIDFLCAANTCSYILVIVVTRSRVTKAIHLSQFKRFNS